jgi:antitoxin component of MazEF toxin-antitoxin module
MSQKVIKVGNSAAITLSQSVLDTLGVKVGEEVEIERLRRDASVIVRSHDRQKEVEETRRERLARFTMDFIDKYRDDLKALADK